LQVKRNACCFGQETLEIETRGGAWKVQKKRGGVGPPQKMGSVSSGVSVECVGGGEVATERKLGRKDRA